MSIEYRLYKKETLNGEIANKLFAQNLKSESAATIEKYGQDVPPELIERAQEILNKAFAEISNYEGDGELICVQANGKTLWYRDVSWIEEFVEMYPDCVVVDEYGKVYTSSEFWKLMRLQ